MRSPRAVFPVLLGASKRMFSDTDKDKQMLKVVESETYANGITKLVYDPHRDSDGGRACAA